MQVIAHDAFAGMFDQPAETSLGGGGWCGVRPLPVADDLIILDRPAPATLIMAAWRDRYTNLLEHCNNGAFLVSHGWPHFQILLALATVAARGYYSMRMRLPARMNRFQIYFTLLAGRAFPSCYVFDYVFCSC